MGRKLSSNWGKWGLGEEVLKGWRKDQSWRSMQMEGKKKSFGSVDGQFERNGKLNYLDTDTAQGQ